MKKFFLKHKNIIMTLVSVLLMISFSMLGSKPKSPDELVNTPAGYIGGKAVTMGQISGARNELTLLREYHFLEVQSDGMTWVGRMWARQGGQEDQIGLFWFLLCQDAARYTSVQVTPEQAIQEAVAMGNTDADVRNGIANTPGVSQLGFALAVSHLHAVGQYLDLLGTFAKPISSMELAADKELRRLRAQYVPIDAAAGWEGIPDDQVKDKLAAQFAAYQDVVATHEPAGPNDPPVFLGVDHDEKGDCALLGYPGSVELPAHVHEGETIAWDGSTLTRVLRKGDFAGFAGGQPVQAPMDIILLSGGGRTLETQLTSGMDIHGNLLPAPPAEVAGAAGHHFAFGYKLPDQVQVEYLKFSRMALRGRLEVTAADVDAALAEFRKNPFSFRKDPDAEAADAVSVLAPGAQPATKPHRTHDQIMADWDDMAVKKPYLDQQLDLRTDRMLAALVSAARTKAEAPWLTSKEVVDPSAWVSYASLADTVAHDPSLTGERGSSLKRWMQGASIGAYVPQKGTTGSAFLDAQALQGLPGIGHALYTKSLSAGPNLGQAFDFLTLATHVKPLVTLERTTALGQLNLELGHECPEVTDQNGNVYLFRVTAISKSHAVAGLDAARGQVLADCKKLAAYNRTLEAVGQALKGASDLTAVAATYHSAVRNPEEFNRDESAAPVDVRNIPDFVKTAFALPDPKETGKPSFTTLPGDATLHAYAIQVLQITPASGPDFADQLSRGFFNSLPDPGVQKFAEQYLDVEALAKRVKFTLAPGTGMHWPRTAPTATATAPL